MPRVPLDNWLLPHLLTSPPLTFLHFTFKVLHFFLPLTSSSFLHPLTPNTRVFHDNLAATFVEYVSFYCCDGSAFVALKLFVHEIGAIYFI